MMNVSVKTESGSLYTVTTVVFDDGERYFLSADHTSTYRSVNVRGKAWQIEKPKYPEIGQPWVLLSAHFSEPEHPDRMPGGGKRTSPVTEIILLDY
jgi:hypothetical protein